MSLILVDRTSLVRVFPGFFFPYIHYHRTSAEPVVFQFLPNCQRQDGTINCGFKLKGKVAVERANTAKAGKWDSRRRHLAEPFWPAATIE
jgi:hypothetical protein